MSTTPQIDAQQSEIQQPDVLSIGASGKLFALAEYAKEARVTDVQMVAFLESELGIRPVRLGETTYYHVGAVEVALLAYSIQWDVTKVPIENLPILDSVIILGSLYGDMERERIKQRALSLMRASREKIISCHAREVTPITELRKEYRRAVRNREIPKANG